MTRKDFELIARVLRVSAPAGTSHEDAVARLQLWRTARLMADALAETNPRFDRARFLRAAEVSDPGRGTPSHDAFCPAAQDNGECDCGLYVEYPHLAPVPVGPTETADVGGEPWRGDQT